MPRDLSVETEVEQLVTTAIDLHAGELAAQDLSVDVDVRGWPDPDSGTSELRITFWRDNNLVDRLETFVFKNGRQVATSEEFEHWLKQSIPAVLRENRT